MTSMRLFLPTRVASVLAGALAIGVAGLASPVSLASVAGAAEPAADPAAVARILAAADSIPDLEAMAPAAGAGSAPALGAPAPGAPPRRARVKTHELQIYLDGLVHGVRLAKGTYRIGVDPSMRAVSIYRGKELVMTAPCRVSMRGEAVMGTSVAYLPRADGTADIVRIELSRPEYSIDLGEETERPSVADLTPAAR